MAASLPIAKQHAESFNVDADDVFIIGRDTPDGQEHPLWRDDAKRPPSLVDTLLEEGQLQEVLCRKAVVRGEKNELVERVEVIFGVDRTISVREINKSRKKNERMPLRIRLVPRGTTDEEIVAMIEAENARRKEQASPIRKAESAKRMLRFKIDEKTILRVQGLTSMETVKRNLGLLELAPAVRAAVDEGRVLPSTALTLKALPVAEQVEKVNEWLADPSSAPSTKAAAREVKESRKPAAERAPAAEGDGKGPPSLRTIGKVVRALAKLDAEQKPKPVSDEVSDVLSALFADEATCGSLPADVYATLRWIKTGRGVAGIKGLTGLLRSVEGK